MKHSSRRNVLLGLAVLVLLVGALWAPLRRQMERWTGEQALVEQIKGTGALAILRLTQGQPETAPYAPVRHSGLSPYGVNTFFEQEADVAQVDRAMAMISAAGIDWIRQEFPWEDIEISAKGDFWDHRWNRSAWDKYDQIVALAEKHDLEIIARLDNPPGWSRAVGNAEGWTLAPPDDLNDYGDFVEAVVTRYKGRIRYYQIWNEPNIYPEWGDQAADPAGYVALLQVAYTRAKAVDPDCVIIAAGLAQTTEETDWIYEPRNVSDIVYLEAMYAAGAQGYFDVMGAMAYGLWTGPHDQRVSRDRANFGRVQLLREIMVAHGDASVPIWATEIGWNALPEGWQGAMPYGAVTLEQQAQYTVQAYQRAADEWPWMGVLNYWFWRRPDESESNQAWYYFRMVAPDWTPQPVYFAVQEQATQPRVLHRGFHQEDAEALQYAGEWRLVQDKGAVLGGGARLEPGASVRFTYSGAGLSLKLGDAASAEHLTITVDGRERPLGRSETVPDTDIAARRVTRAPWRGQHSVVLAATDGPVLLDGLIVYREPARWPWLLALAMVFAGLALLWWHCKRAARS
ncbi:MAG: hypothetical protein ABFD20_06980 [Anaerolineales bacterium]